MVLILELLKYILHIIYRFHLVNLKNNNSVCNDHTICEVAGAQQFRVSNFHLFMNLKNNLFLGFSTPVFPWLLYLIIIFSSTIFITIIIGLLESEKSFSYWVTLVQLTFNILDTLQAVFLSNKHNILAQTYWDVKKLNFVNILWT